MDKIELKPCPFCKGEALMWRQGFVRKKLVSCSDNECGAFFTKFTPEEWNSRPIEDELHNKFTKSEECIREWMSDYNKNIDKLEKVIEELQELNEILVSNCN